ncbi:MAG: TatD family hydrolase [Thermoleophilia bacterium]|nr:TatD family hydrolase [Thermoleophilia bacterium]
MGGLIDCHAHLADPVFDADRDEVLARARDAGVTRVITVGETLQDAHRILELAPQHPEMLPAAGLYPTFLDLAQAERMEALVRENRDRLVAIGEVGLDHWKVKEPGQRELQREIFSRFVRLSLELDLPLNIHSRSAGRHVIALLLELGARRVQLHAFDGKPSTALPAVEAGYFFSIPASAVYSQQKQKLVRRLPLSCMLLETDSPVMAPVRGERNEPANVIHALKAIAELKQVSEDEVATITTDNTRRLFALS